MRFEVTLLPMHPLSTEGVTDLIETLVDGLDERGHIADVSASGTGHEVVLTVAID